MARVPTPFDAIEFDEKIAKVREDKELASEEQDFEKAAALRDEEKSLLAERLRLDPGYVTRLVAGLERRGLVRRGRDARDRRRVRLSLTLVLAGGLGNLIDRALYGAVIDYIELTFMTFPVFNFADICVTMGAAMFALFTLLPGKREARA